MPINTTIEHGFDCIAAVHVLGCGLCLAWLVSRTAGDMPGLDIAEQKSWQTNPNAALRMYAVLNIEMLEKHQLPLSDVRLLHVLNNFPDGTARMRELAEALPAPGSRLTRQTRRLEARGLLRRGATPDDRRGVVGHYHRRGPSGGRSGYGQLRARN